MIKANYDDVRAAGVAELDRAEREIVDALPVGDRQSPEDRLARAHELRIDFARNHHLNTKGQPLDLSEPWLLPIYESRARRMALMKSVQCGVSEYLVCRTFAEAAAGRTVLYVLPSYPIRNRFVAQRFDRPLLMIARYRQLQYEAIGDSDSRALKQLGSGAIYFVGSNTPNEFIEIAADTSIVDELDSCDAENIVMVPDRLAAADLPCSIEVSQPTHREFGIHAAYLESDQRQWEVKCRFCGTWQPLDFFVNVLAVERDDTGEVKAYELRDTKWRAESGRDVDAFCAKCGLVLDRLENDAKLCRWRPTNPGPEIEGRHIHKLLSRRARLEDLYVAWVLAQGDATKTARFYRSDLGLPYSPAGSTLTDELLNRCVREHSLRQSSSGPCTMGIDVGSFWDVRISDMPEKGARRALFIGRMDGPKPCAELIARFNVRCCVIDARPETRLAKEFQKEINATHKQLVWRADFEKGESITEPKKDYVEGTVKVDRTALLDAATADILGGRNRLPAGAASLLKGEYYRQMKAPKRILEETPSGQRYIWTKGNDHARFADAYDKLASMIGGRQLAALAGSLSQRTSGDQIHMTAEGYG